MNEEFFAKPNPDLTVAITDPEKMQQTFGIAPTNKVNSPKRFSLFSVKNKLDHEIRKTEGSDDNEDHEHSPRFADQRTL